MSISKNNLQSESHTKTDTGSGTPFLQLKNVTSGRGHIKIKNYLQWHGDEVEKIHKKSLIRFLPKNFNNAVRTKLLYIILFGFSFKCATDNLKIWHMDEFFKSVNLCF